MIKILKQIVKDLIPNNLMISRLNRKASNSILFSFDDGPHERLTPMVLELLEEHQIRAIFFIIGRCAHKNPHLLELIRNKGHYIGNHSYEHPDDGPLPGFFAFRKDILKCQALVKEILGIAPCFFRPPRGIINPKTLLVPKNLGLRTVLWSRAGGDWGNPKSDDHSTLARVLLETLSPRDIVLLHDDNPKVPKMLEIILPAIKSREFDVSTGIETLLY